MVKINFIFRFYLPIFFLISYSAYFSMQHCFERYVLREMFYTFLISTFRISYIIFHHRNIIFYLFSSKFFRNMCVIYKQRCLGTGLALKLSKSFNFQGLIEKNLEKLSLIPGNYRVFLGKRKHQCPECSRDRTLRMINCFNNMLKAIEI